MASSFETHRFATLLRMRSSSLDEVLTLMVRSRALRGVSNHEAAGEAQLNCEAIFADADPPQAVLAPASGAESAGPAVRACSSMASRKQRTFSGISRRAGSKAWTLSGSLA